jgi:ADP-dependent NAD(P)H-hydrate dehydratase / NAD(P)H-hydrate epimerase
MAILRRQGYEGGMNSDADVCAVLSVAEMARADAAAIQAGTPGEALMAAAGAAVADEVLRRAPSGAVAVLCGPGNNGGDGFVAARLLRERGRQVRVALSGERARLKGDAAVHAQRWTGPVEPLATAALEGAEIIVDALFGAGLARPLDGAVREVVAAINARSLPCIAVDVPSGVFGDTGQVLGGDAGVAPRCQATVTFFRRKPAHLLSPGRSLCGDVTVAQIGIAPEVLAAIAPRCHENAPALWQKRFPWPTPEGHKYRRGHAVVVGGGTMTGAGRLAARAAARVGAGLVTIAGPSAALPVYALAGHAMILARLDDAQDFSRLMDDPRRNAVLLGPGAGADQPTRLRVIAALSAGKRCVIDADALTVFADDPEHLCRAVRRTGGEGANVLLTPHDGEFARLFPDLAKAHADDKLARTRAAAARSGATVLLKGHDTVIAAPDGRAAINANAPPDLATAGAGDVLAGLAVGLLAQGLEAFDAAGAAVWLHGEAAQSFGPGLIADDLTECLPAALRKLKTGHA